MKPANHSTIASFLNLRDLPIEQLSWEGVVKRKFGGSDPGWNHTDETKELMALRWKSRAPTKQSTKEKMSATRKTMRWYNDGVTERMSSTPIEGFVAGRIGWRSEVNTSR
jgi:hypothetical protein